MFPQICGRPNSTFKIVSYPHADWLRLDDLKVAETINFHFGQNYWFWLSFPSFANFTNIYIGIFALHLSTSVSVDFWMMF